MSISIAAISDQPGLAPIVAEWLVQAFGHPGGRSVEDMTALILSPPVGPEETFVLFEQDRPVGTASLAAKDLQARPDLTPWLAGVFVHPAFRRHGYAAALVRKVEAFATATSLQDVWPYT